MKKTIWVKPFVGPFTKEEAETLAADLKKVAEPAKNLIYNAEARPRKEPGMFDVMVLTIKTNMFLNCIAKR